MLNNHSVKFYCMSYLQNWCHIIIGRFTSLNVRNIKNDTRSLCLLLMISGWIWAKLKMSCGVLNVGETFWSIADPCSGGWYRVIRLKHLTSGRQQPLYQEFWAQLWYTVSLSFRISDVCAHKYIKIKSTNTLESLCANAALLLCLIWIMKRWQGDVSGPRGMERNETLFFIFIHRVIKKKTKHILFKIEAPYVLNVLCLVLDDQTVPKSETFQCISASWYLM